MILQPGSKVLIVHRRLFREDQPRYFVGQIEEYENGIVSVTGFTWIRDPFKGTLLKKQDLRTKIVSLSSGTFLVYRLATDVDLTQLTIESDGCSNVCLTDGRELSIDLTENVHHLADK